MITTEAPSFEWEQQVLSKTANQSTWNKVIAFPTELPSTTKRSESKPYKCQHCKAAFSTGHSLGGHMRKSHLGKATLYASKKAKRQGRIQERGIYAIAKSLHFSMKDKTIDPLTLNTFKWIKNRYTAAERAEFNLGQNGPTNTICEKECNKGRIRRLKVKVKRVMSLPRSERQALLSPSWMDLFD